MQATASAFNLEAERGVPLNSYPFPLSTPSVYHPTPPELGAELRAGGLSPSVGTGMGDSLRAGIPPRYVSSHPGLLSLLFSVGREMSTGHSAVVLGIKGSFHSWISVRVAGKTA